MAAPGLVQTYHKFKNRGVQFIGLVAEGEEALGPTQAFVDRFHITWPNGYGAEATIAAYGVEGFPTTIVIGSNGLIAWNDSLDGDLERAIEKALAASKK